jgi:hypothetical protein
MQVKINKVKQNKTNNKVKDVRAKTPLAEVFYFLPGNGARKTCLMSGK